MRKLIVVCSVLILGACGFQPLHGNGFQKNIEISKKLERIAIANIANREGQYLRNALIDRFYTQGRPDQADYTLHVSRIIETKRNLDITIESDTTREQLRLNADMQLVNEKNGTVILQRSLYAISSFNVLENEYATRVSEQSTRENALNDLARQIETQIALYMKR